MQPPARAPSATHWLPSSSRLSGRLGGPRQHRADGLQPLAGLAAKDQGNLCDLWGKGHAHLMVSGWGKTGD